MLKRFINFSLLFLCLPVIARAQAPVELWADIDYAGTHSGTQAQPFGAIDGAAWSVINRYLAQGDVTIHFSARDAKTDTDDGPLGTIDLTLKSEATSNRLVLDGSKYYNTNDSNPNWTTYNSSGDCIPRSFAPPHASCSFVNSFVNQNSSHVKHNNISIAGFRIVSTAGSKGASLCGDNLVLSYNDISANRANGGPSVLLVPTADGTHEGSNSWCPPSSNIVISHNYVHHTFSEAIYVGGGGCTLPAPSSNCDGFPSHNHVEVTFNNIYSTAEAVCIAPAAACRQGDGIDIKPGVTNLLVADNYIHDLLDRNGNGVRAIVTQGQIPGYPPLNMVIERNVINNIKVFDAAVSYSDTWGTPSYVVFRNNSVSNVTTSGHTGTCLVVYSGSNLDFYNNVFYNCAGSGYGMDITSSSATNISNNAIVTGGVNTHFSGTHTAINNAYSGSWSGACTNCVSGLTSSDFVDVAGQNFFPSTASKLKDAGTTIASFATDYLGRARPEGSAWDIGSYEYTLDSTPPTVALSSPNNLAKVGGTVTVSATAADDIGVASVQFQVDGSSLGPKVKAPYALAWDTTLVSEGLHILTAVAQDVAGHVTISSPITVTVENRTASYGITPGGAQVFEVRGSSNTNTTIGHAYIDGGNNSPTGIAIVSYDSAAGNTSGSEGADVPSSVVVSELGVPATVETFAGMAYVDIAGFLSTGVAIANETSYDAVIDYYFTDEVGGNVKKDTLTLAAHHQISGFLDSPPFSIPSPFRGTFTFNSSVPVAAIAIRNLINERGEYVWSSMPISTAVPTGNRLLPTFADGGEWTTQVVLTNGSANTIAGSVEFFGQGTPTAAAAPLTLTVNGAAGSSFRYSIPAHSTYRMVTQGQSSATINSGSVRVTPDTQNPTLSVAPNAFEILTYRSNNVTISETSVFSTTADTAFRVYVESSTSSDGETLSGIAVANADPNPNPLTLELATLDGTAIGGPLSVTLPGNGELSKFANELFTNLPSDFRGLLRITSIFPIGVVDLRARYNGRNDFLVSTIPPINENAPATGAVVFPHVVSGGGYSTEIILFGTSGVPTSGTVVFTAANGTPMLGADAITP